jgi:hypothetical protein
MALGTRRTPERGSPFFSGVVLPVKGVTSVVVTTGTSPLTGTAAQFLQGLLPVDCQDTGTLTTPTATLLNAAIPGVAAGTSFDLDVINYGDSTLTIGLGTGVTKTTIATVAAVMTIVTLASKRFTFVCTSVANPSDPSTSDAWTVWAHGSIAAAAA